MVAPFIILSTHKETHVVVSRCYLMTTCPFRADHFDTRPMQASYVSVVATCKETTSYKEHQLSDGKRFVICIKCRTVMSLKGGIYPQVKPSFDARTELIQAHSIVYVQPTKTCSSQTPSSATRCITPIQTFASDFVIVEILEKSTHMSFSSLLYIDLSF